MREVGPLCSLSCLTHNRHVPTQVECPASPRSRARHDARHFAPQGQRAGAELERRRVAARLAERGLGEIPGPVFAPVVAAQLAVVVRIQLSQGEWGRQEQRCFACLILSSLPQSPHLTPRSVEQSPDGLSRSRNVRVDSAASQRQDKKAMKQAQQDEARKSREAEAWVQTVLEVGMQRAALSLSDVGRDVPRVALRQVASMEPVCVCGGPKALDEAPRKKSSGAPRIANLLAGRSVSTYPLLPDSSTRAGWPICDTYYGEFQKEGTALLCVCDGCGWGFRSREAATRANAALAEHMARCLPRVRDSRDVVEMLLRGIGEAHRKVVEGKEDLSIVGTTTILGGVVMPLRDALGKFMFFFVSVGDCKAFCWKGPTNRFVDVTVGARGDNDARDPGGRIGPQAKQGLPDLRNLQVGSCVCEAGDMIVLTSDGVSDNFDPQFSGLLPGECGIVETDNWDRVDPVTRASAKSAWGARKMTEVVMAAAAHEEHLTPDVIVEALLGHCVELTRKSREWLESRPIGRQPDDYRLYPGKLDHTTCLCYCVN